jgi:hypothetical protein
VCRTGYLCRVQRRQKMGLSRVSRAVERWAKAALWFADRPGEMTLLHQVAKEGLTDTNERDVIEERPAFDYLKSLVGLAGFLGYLLT